jgi:hypothetical protein
MRMGLPYDELDASGGHVRGRLETESTAIAGLLGERSPIRGGTPTRRAVLQGFAAAAALAAFGAERARAAGAPALRAGAKLRAVETSFRFLTTRDGREFERGRETAAYQFHDDGLIGVRIHSESDSPAVVRDAIYTLDSAWRPRECLLRIQNEGRHEGSGWFRFEDDVATFEGWNVKTGRISQRIALESPVTALVAHPVTTDAMLAASYVHGRPGPSMQRLAGAFLSSADPYGRTGPLLTPSDSYLDYAGRETVETPAGPAEADHYLLYLPENGKPAAEPLQDLWCLAGTALLLRARARGSYQTRYEPVRLEAR